ncbi:TPM domain-containing protein [Haloferula sargassicola]|uniref:TPM domain-containing protein n=1 Tax=Haloferula sargassicola TaxID=490096 RepID=A0ABP9UHG6_9BACT
MKCPRCVQVIHRGAEVCPHCAFSLSAADELYGTEGPEIERLDDKAGLMTRHAHDHVQRAIDHFERKFPQLWFAVHTGRPPRGGDLRQHGFWLLNRANFTDLQTGRSREGGVLLVIDPDARQAGMTWGYRLDGHLGEDDTFLALSRAHAYWVEEHYADGIVRVIQELTRVLIKRARRAKRLGRRRKGGAA